MNQIKKTKTKYLAVAIAAVFLLVFILLKPTEYQIAELNTFISQYQSIAPFMVIGLIIAEVVIAPLPGYVIPVASGLFFGPFLGFLYAWIGNVIGSLLAFGISRFIRRSVLKKLVSKKKLQYYHHILTDSDSLLWLFYIFPIFPVDIISFAAGISNISYKRFLKIVAIGFIPNMLVLTLFGDALVAVSIERKILISLAFMIVLTLSLWVEERVDARKKVLDSTV